MPTNTGTNEWLDRILNTGLQLYQTKTNTAAQIKLAQAQQQQQQGNAMPAWLPLAIVGGVVVLVLGVVLFWRK